MNNRYRFRGKREDNGEWIEGWITTQYKKGFDSKILFTRIKSNVFGGGEHLVDTETVGQCTERKYANDKLLFEGDIVKWYSDYDDAWGYSHTAEDYGVVVWNANDYCWDIKVNDELIPFNDYDWDISMVVGNIHDNPELLEVER